LHIWAFAAVGIGYPVGIPPSDCAATASGPEAVPPSPLEYPRMTWPMSVQTPFVHTEVLVCWQSAFAEQSWACVALHATTHAGSPVPPLGPHVWQQEFGASHVAPSALHVTLCAP
jgi:hypothetical protein